MLVDGLARAKLYVPSVMDVHPSPLRTFFIYPLLLLSFTAILVQYQHIDTGIRWSSLEGELWSHHIYYYSISQFVGITITWARSSLFSLWDAHKYRPFCVILYTIIHTLHEYCLVYDLYNLIYQTIYGLMLSSNTTKGTKYVGIWLNVQLCLRYAFSIIQLRHR